MYTVDKKFSKLPYNIKCQLRHSDQVKRYLIIHELQCESRLANTTTTDHDNFVNYTCHVRLGLVHFQLKKQKKHTDTI